MPRDLLALQSAASRGGVFLSDAFRIHRGGRPCPSRPRRAALVYLDLIVCFSLALKCDKLTDLRGRARRPALVATMRKQAQILLPSRDRRSQRVSRRRRVHRTACRALL